MATAVTHGGVRFAANVAADLAEMVTVRDALADALNECGWVEEDAFRVLLCADEAMANACSHGECATGGIDVRFDVDLAAASVVVGDRRAQNTAIPMPATPPDESNEHGRGLILMRALADTFLVSPRPGGTMVALSFCATAGGV